MENEAANLANFVAAVEEFRTMYAQYQAKPTKVLGKKIREKMRTIGSLRVIAQSEVV
ncbi:MAG: hypothetical protein WC325_09385 [Candidatus Bathyarchaeia archaeon]